MAFIGFSGEGERAFRWPSIIEDLLRRPHHQADVGPVPPVEPIDGPMKPWDQRVPDKMDI